MATTSASILRGAEKAKVLVPLGSIKGYGTARWKCSDLGGCKLVPADLFQTLRPLFPYVGLDSGTWVEATGTDANIGNPRASDLALMIRRRMKVARHADEDLGNDGDRRPGGGPDG